jgi:hypothetical protein
MPELPDIEVYLHALRPRVVGRMLHGLSPVQGIRYAENEVNYCAQCQTGGRLLADRALSRLLKQDWPRSLEELEQLIPASPGFRPGSERTR